MMKELVTLTERRWIAEHAVKQLGKAITFPVIDLDKAIEKIKADRATNNLSPYVEIQPVSPDMHKMPNKLTTFQKDPITSVLYGIALAQDDFGNIRWQKIQLHDHLSLNLDKVSDAKIWCVLRFYPEIQGSPWQVENPYYKIFDPTDDAMAQLGEINAMRKAFGRIEAIQDKPREMILFARYLGEDLRENSNINIIIGTLYSFAKKYPIDFNNKWEGKNRSFAERFFSGVAIGVITQDADKGFMYRKMQLGYSEEESVNYLSRDSNIMSALNQDIEENDVLTRSLSIVPKEEEKAEKKKDEPKPPKKDPEPKDSKKEPAEKKPEKEKVEVDDGDAQEW